MADADTPLSRATALIQQGIDERQHLGAQLYVSQHGKRIANIALGESRPGVTMRPFTLMLWLSSTKPVAAVAIAQLWEKGKLSLDDRVAQHIPDFAQNGKDGITLRHILTHTGGFRGLVGQWEDQPWEQLIEQVCRARLEPGWAPGRKAGYHLHTSWYILGELVRRLDGRPFEQYVREMIFLPLGMSNCWIGGMSKPTYDAYSDRIGLMHDTSAAGPREPEPGEPEPGEPEPREPELREPQARERDPRPSHPLDSPAGSLQCRPGSNGRGPMCELGRLYEALLGHGSLEGGRILSPQAVEAMTAVHRVGMYDHTFRHVIDWGLGFIRNSSRYGADTVPYGFGPHASDRAFGHSGSQSSIAMADPEHGLVIALAFNGMSGEAAHNRRVRAVLRAVYGEVGAE